MFISNKGINPKCINGRIAILCDTDALTSATSLIQDFNGLNDISLYMENKNKVYIYNGLAGTLQLKGSVPDLQLQCSLGQCFSPLDYSCTICIGNSSSFRSITECCSRYATPVYVLDGYAS